MVLKCLTMFYGNCTSFQGETGLIGCSRNVCGPVIASLHPSVHAQHPLLKRIGIVGTEQMLFKALDRGLFHL